MKQERVAIVVQRYGEEVNGGAEQAARWLAEHLAEHFEVHVITTCATDYTTWADVYPPGQDSLNNVCLHRFPVDEARHWQHAQKATGRFLLRERTLDEEIDWIRREGPFSTPLLQYIKLHEAAFDVFIFFTYLYATTFFGLPLVADKSILVPTAHDEPFLYMAAYRALLQLPGHLIYLTAAEKKIVTAVAGNGHLPSDVTAVGIDRPSEIQSERFRQKYGVEGDFLLYGGRISQGKNVPELLTYFQRYLERFGGRLKLVLMGIPHINLPVHPNIVPIGFVSERDKFDALDGAMAVIQPSLFESLSIIILEAWRVKTPVIVNGHCAVTREQCHQSNGGLYYTSYEEFEAVLHLLSQSASLRSQMGKQGLEFVMQYYGWEEIVATYQDVIEDLSRDSSS